MDDRFIPPSPPPRPQSPPDRTPHPDDRMVDGRRKGERTAKGTKVGFQRTRKGSTTRKLDVRDDLWALVTAKAKREHRPKRSIVEAALYWFFFEFGETGNIPHPDDPSLNPENPRHEKHFKDMEHLDRG